MAYTAHSVAKTHHSQSFYVLCSICTCLHYVHSLAHVAGAFLSYSYSWKEIARGSYLIGVYKYLKHGRSQTLFSGMQQNNKGQGAQTGTQEFHTNMRKNFPGWQSTGTSARKGCEVSFSGHNKTHLHAFFGDWLQGTALAKRWAGRSPDITLFSGICSSQEAAVLDCEGKASPPSGIQAGYKFISHCTSQLSLFLIPIKYL